MALGGGTIKTTTFPGSYINFVKVKNSSNVTINDRGIVAMCVKLPTTTPTNVVECSVADFYGATKPLGTASTVESMWMFHEVFKHATKVVVYNLTNEGTSLEAGLTALESYEFNVIVTDSTEDSEVNAIIAKVKDWRDNTGKKVQVVYHVDSGVENANHIGAICVATKAVVESGDSLHTTASSVYWVAGAMAGCEIYKSCTNMLYDGDLTLDVAHSQAELQEYINNGQIAFHLVYGDVRLLEDVNTLKDVSDDQNEDFKYNQTIRVIDQIANDISYLFCTKYLGRIQNNASGRVSLWNDIVSHHKKLETMGAIENFNSENVVVQLGDTLRSVVVQDSISIVGTMSQLFMTVVLE